MKILVISLVIWCGFTVVIKGSIDLGNRGGFSKHSLFLAVDRVLWYNLNLIYEGSC